MSEFVKRNLISMKAACRKGGFGRTKCYELIAEGKIVAYKQDHQTMVDDDSLDAYQASLPRLFVAPPKPRKKRPASAADVPV